MIMAEADWERLFPIVETAVQMLFVVAVLALICWVATRKTRMKQKMVERGFTAEQIKEVMDAGKK